jgi:hypothetical protein
MLGEFPIEIYIIITRYEWEIYKSMIFVCKKLHEVIPQLIDRRIYAKVAHIINTQRGYTGRYERILCNMQQREFKNYYKVVEIEDNDGYCAVYKPHVTTVYSYNTIIDHDGVYIEITGIHPIRITADQHAITRRCESITIDRKCNAVSYMIHVIRYEKDRLGGLVYRADLKHDYEQLNVYIPLNKWYLTRCIDGIVGTFNGTGSNWEFTLMAKSSPIIRRYLPRLSGDSVVGLEPTLAAMDAN